MTVGVGLVGLVAALLGDALVLLAVALVLALAVALIDPAAARDDVEWTAEALALLLAPPLGCGRMVC